MLQKTCGKWGKTKKEQGQTETQISTSCCRCSQWVKFCNSKPNVARITMSRIVASLLPTGYSLAPVTTTTGVLNKVQTWQQTEPTDTQLLFNPNSKTNFEP